MAWFAAHAIMYVRFKDGVQTPTPVWENVLLIEGPEDGDLAFEEAEKRAREDEGDSEGSFRWDGRPAEWVFAESSHSTRPIQTPAVSSCRRRPFSTGERRASTSQ